MKQFRLLIISIIAFFACACSQKSEQKGNSLNELENFVALYNAQCPQKINEYLDLERIYIDNDYIVFRYVYDADIISIDTNDTAEMREATLESLKEEYSGEEGAQQLKLINDCGFGMKYVYASSDGNTADVDIIISADELKNI